MEAQRRIEQKALLNHALLNGCVESTLQRSAGTACALAGEINPYTGRRGWFLLF